MKTGDRVKQRRIELGLTQEELAIRMGNKSRASISTIENNRDDLTTTRIKKLADALECTPAYLMGWTDDAQSIIDKEKELLSMDRESLENYFITKAKKDNEFWSHIHTLFNLKPEIRKEIYGFIDYKAHTGDMGESYSSQDAG